MLRRRLLLLAAVLLATGAIAAALTPRDLRQGDATTATTPPSPPPTTASGGTRPGARQRTATVDASLPKPVVVRVREGTLLRLVVKAPSPDEVELVGLGRFAPVDQYSPARFEFFATRGGTFPIRLRESDQTIGRLVVDARPL